ncbi:helix-turn-helix transcriptional regulator [Lapidilactobacillus bayanensis]|uniref:helix-turn-helix transcriptional regulator n=1 Tax=Lapidilactobacillus bayanensis TaxID=2485998 RepID=UPI000F78BF01|nr:helix-turn-helix domain-containing protein [Lapidilactobacillus bayanensis]
MNKNLPYTSVEYLSASFQPNELKANFFTLNQSTSLQYFDEFDFLLIQSGQGAIEINGQLFPVHADQLIELAPFHVHRFILTDSNNLTGYHVRLSLGLLILASTNRQTYLNTINNLDLTVPIVRLDQSANEHLMAMIQLVLEEQRNNTPGSEGLNLSLTALLSFYFQKFLQRQDKSNRFFTFDWRLLQYIHFYHQEQLTTRKVATHFGLSVEVLQKKIKKMTGYSFRALLNQIRIRNATALLQFNELSINQIGKICGYQSEANFYKQFELIHQQTPEQMRMDFSSQFLSTDAWDIVLYMLENSQQNLTIDDIAAHAKLSTDSINARLQQTFGQSFHALKQQMKCQIAHNLIAATNLTKQEIANKLGYPSEQTFLRNYQSYLNAEKPD